MNARSGKRGVAAQLTALASIALAASGCAVDRQTQITLALTSETEIPQELDSFSVRVIATRTGELRFAKDYFPASGRDFPSTLAVIPVDEDSLNSPLRFEVEGRKGGVTTLRRAAVLGYFRGRNLLLSMPLRMACFQFRDCGSGATCAGGQCVDAGVDSATLPEFDGRHLFPEGGACFDEQACLIVLFLRVALGYRRPAEVTLSRDGVRVRSRTEMLGRMLRSYDVVIAREALMRATREVRYPRAAFYAGLLALALGSYFGMAFLVDGIRAASLSMLVAGFAVAAVGIALDFALSSIAPGVTGRCRLVFLPQRGYSLCVADVDARRADAALSLLT